jgi:type IV pilus assembly protein PilF
MNRLRVLLLLPAFLGFACAHTPSEREQTNARIHYDLALERQRAGDATEAYREIEKSLALDPTFAPAHNAKGLMLHLSFDRPEEALKAYKRALELDPRFSEVHTNLGNVHLSAGRYDEAIKHYELALSDMLYVTPWFAQGNLGWAHYKAGRTDEGIKAIRRAIDLNAGFCQGHRNLGIIYEEQGDSVQALSSYQAYAEACPDIPEAHLRLGKILAAQGDADEARNAFALCEAKSTDRTEKDACRRLSERLESP